MMFTVVLPYPPSANTMYRAVKGRVIKSKRYRAWLVEVGWQIRFQHAWQWNKINIPVSVTIELVKPDKRKRDNDNAVKPILDALQAYHVIADDSLVKRHTVIDRTGEDVGFEGARVTVMAAREAMEGNRGNI